MSNQIEAIYENGMFRPLAPVELPEQQRVTVTLPDDVDSANSNGNSNDVQEPWTDEKNARRCDLIDKEIEGTITDSKKICPLVSPLSFLYSDSFLTYFPLAVTMTKWNRNDKRGGIEGIKKAFQINLTSHTKGEVK